MSKKLQPEEIEKLLLNGRRLTANQIASRTGRLVTSVGPLLLEMVKDGRVKRVRESMPDSDEFRAHFVYYTTELEVAAPRTYKANLSADLKGYVDNLMQFANLALATRR